jgi:hypothetical protein
MGATITKEIDIELEYNDIKDAVSDLSNSEKSLLIEDCELGEDIKSEIADDLSSFIDDNCSDFDEVEAVKVIQSVLENLNSDSPTSDVLNKVISELDDDVVAELNVDAGEGGDVTQTQKEFLNIVARYMDEEGMEKVVSKHEKGAELLKGFLEFLAK